MNLSFFLAKKYYFSKSSKSFVNIISAIAIGIISLMVIAEVTVLSAFNGFSDQLLSIYESSDCDLEISPKESKTFHLDGDIYRQINELEHVTAITRVIEDNAMLEFGGKQEVVRFRAVENNFFDQNSLDEKIVRGVPHVFDSTHAMLLGYVLARKFDVNTSYNTDKIPGTNLWMKVLYPNRKKKHLTKNKNSFKSVTLRPIGEFQVEMDFDGTYIIFPIKYAQTLTGYDKETITSLEIAVDFPDAEAGVAKKINSLIPETAKLTTRFKRHESIFKTVNIEKLMAYFIFSLVIIIASLNLYAAMTLLIVNKKKDISTLNTIGASREKIRSIFLYEGLLVIGSGLLIGAVVAFGFVWLQANVGLIEIGDTGEFVPMKFHLRDFILCLALTLFISLIMILRPILRSTKTLN